jgi:hypothetical protein
MSSKFSPLTSMFPCHDNGIVIKIHRKILQLYADVDNLQHQLKHLENVARDKKVSEQLLAAANNELKAVRNYTKSCYADSMRTAKRIMKSGISGLGDDQSYYGSCVSETFMDSVRGLTAGVNNYFTGDATRTLPADNVLENISFDAAPAADSNVSFEEENNRPTAMTSSVRDLLIKNRKFSSDNLLGRHTNSAPVLQLTGRQSAQIDYDAVWNSTKSECTVMHGPLRQLLRMQRKNNTNGLKNTFSMPNL